MQIKAYAQHWCLSCNKLHKSNDLIECCDYCLRHEQHYYNLNKQGLSKRPEAACCGDCLLFIKRQYEWNITTTTNNNNKSKEKEKEEVNH